MSRIIKSIINSVLGSDDNSYIIFHSNNRRDNDIINILNVPCFCSEQEKLNNSLVINITNKDIEQNLSICPRYIINTDISKYNMAKHLSDLLRIPLFNIFDSVTNIKKEGAFNLASVIDQDINLFFDKNIVDQLFLTKYTLITDINQIPPLIREALKTWKPV